MKQIQLGTSPLMVPQVVVGCMRMADRTTAQIEKLVRTAMEHGANYFDHADIYGGGACESLFSKGLGLTPALREKMVLQSKCGICPEVMYDFSKEHILSSVDGILKRLNTEYLDVLLLHRPDMLMEPEEVAEAFDRLEASGKVRYFGVSNQNPMQIQLLEKYLNQPLVANQLQFGIAHAGLVTEGIHVNMLDDGGISRTGSVLDFCRLHEITIQAWSPFQYGFFEGVFLGNEKFPELNRKLEELAQKYQTTSTAIAAAWIMRHPANIQIVTGTMDLTRLLSICEASDLRLTREEWYQIYLAAGNTLP